MQRILKHHSQIKRLIKYLIRCRYRNVVMSSQLIASYLINALQGQRRLKHYCSVSTKNLSEKDQEGYFLIAEMFKFRVTHCRVQLQYYVSHWKVKSTYVCISEGEEVFCYPLCVCV